MNYRWQAWAFVTIFGVGAVFKTVADRRVADGTERAARAIESEVYETQYARQVVEDYLTIRGQLSHGARDHQAEGMTSRLDLEACHQ